MSDLPIDSDILADYINKYNQDLDRYVRAKRISDLMKEAETLLAHLREQLDFASTTEDCWRLYSRLIHLNRQFDVLTLAAGKKADTL